MIDFCSIYTTIQNLKNQIFSIVLGQTAFQKSLGTMSVQNADNVAITGGKIAAGFNTNVIFTVAENNVELLSINVITAPTTFTINFPPPSESLVGQWVIVANTTSNSFSTNTQFQFGVNQIVGGTLNWYFCIPDQSGYTWYFSSGAPIG